MRFQHSGRRGISLIEVLVILAIIAILLGLALPGMQKSRETAAQSRCANNMRELGLGIQHFQDVNMCMPPYWDSFPKPESSSIKGSWFNHILPYVDQNAFYSSVMDNIRKTGSNWDGYNVSTQQTVQQWVEDSPGYWVGKPDTWVVDSEGHYKLELETFNGHTHWVEVWTAATGHFQKNGGTWHPPKGHNVEVQQKVVEHKSTIGGVFMPGANDTLFPILQCPSDPSPGSYPDASLGRVYVTNTEGSWGSTNYLANWHAFAGDDPQSGYASPAQKMSTLTDGLANTILLGEGYSWCDDKGRVALNSWDYHSFGLTWALPKASVDIGNGVEAVNFPNGMPNTIMFQVRPQALSVDDCPYGTECCNNWTAQTGHAAMNIALADGSIRSITPKITAEVWFRLLKPRDGQSVQITW